MASAARASGFEDGKITLVPTSQATSIAETAELLGAVAWPLVALVFVLLFQGPLRQLLRRDDVHMQGPGGFSISAKRREVAVASLVKASKARPGEPLRLEEAASGVEVASGDAEALGRPPRVLWVDDRPSNVRFEAAAFQALGVYVRLTTSTAAALVLIAEDGPWDAVISDMGRPPDPTAGYTLLMELRNRGDSTPLVIYATSRSAEHFDMSVERGAEGCTNRPDELVELVSNALRGQVARKTPKGRAKWWHAFKARSSKA